MLVALVNACFGQGSITEGIRDAIAEGYSAQQITEQLIDAVVQHAHLTEKQKAYICVKLGAVDKCLTEGADEELQLIDALLYMAEAIATK